MRVHRFQSPFEHWVLGLLSELATFAIYLVVLGALCALIAWVL